MERIRQTGKARSIGVSNFLVPAPGAGARGNFDVLDFALSDAEVEAITALERGGRVSAHPDEVN